MKKFLRISRQPFTSILLLVALWSPFSSATVSDVPLYVTQSVKPQLMLTMSNDHQLFYKAYDDFSDITGDGVPDTTYDHSHDYYGYFDSGKCYVYDTAENRFEPVSVTGNKYCNNSTTGQWSGNFLNWVSMARIDTVRKILYGGKRSTDTSSDTVLERTYLPNDAHSWAKYYKGNDVHKLTPFSPTDNELTICNTTVNNSSAFSQDVTDPPLLRVAQGNYSLWAANERWQCRWSEEKSASNGNDPVVTGYDAASSNPSKASKALGEGDYTVRVQVCVSGLIGNEECKRYPNGNYKPTGLLQDYGDGSEMLFGLMTGSYGKNKSGGVLRRNMGDMSAEVNADTDGTFKTPPATGSIIGNLDLLRIFGYEHGNDGTYRDATDGDNCNWGLNSFTNGNCSNWGNPQSEIFLEALRYFAGKSASSAFNTDDSSYISGLTTASWNDPIDSTNWCAPLSIIHFNASVSSYDGDELSGASDIGISGGVSSLTKAIGDAEGISGNDYFVGETASDTDQLCTPKTVSNLGDVEGTCPDAPRLGGTYHIAGLAYHAYTNDIRNDVTGDQMVKTYGVTLSPAVPKIIIPVPSSSPQRTVTILPACQNKNVGGNCAIVDFKVVEPYTLSGGTATGKVLVNWEDSEQGGDYDQDMWGILSYSINANTIQVTTDVLDHSTSSSFDMAFGYVISGTEQDGFHAHSGINNYDYTDPYDSYADIDGCNNCNTADGPTSNVYNIGTSTTGLLEQPLFYAAKWGGFNDENEDGDPVDSSDPSAEVGEWDADGDGQPDNYFHSTDPSQLKQDLSDAFSNVAATNSSAASVVANSVTLETDTHIYQARYNSEYWVGTVLSLPINSDGSVGDPDWRAHEKVDSQNYDAGRKIITWDDSSGTGTAFRWTGTTTINADQKAHLNTNLAGGTDTLGSDRLDFLRGDRSNELQQGGDFRDRESALGDIVASTPAYVGDPGFEFADDLEDDPATYPSRTYRAFRTAINALNSGAGRTPVLYAGGNDGMLHGFNANTGEEVLAYVPNAVYPHLSALTDQNYTHRFYVDGTPTHGDAFGAFPGCASSPCWRTVLVGSLAAGGDAIFALDVTEPDSFAESSADEIVLWEIDSNDTGYSELGYTFSRPAVVKVAADSDDSDDNGDWVAVFGNGFNSANGHAVLYVTRLTDGTLIRSITLDDTGGNGLATPAPVDVDSDSVVDFVYVGDLKGNLWKVDLTNTDETKWASSFKSGNTPEPLFKAVDSSGNPQPITSGLDVGHHPAGLGGYMIYFGTGKYFETGDNDPANINYTNSFYGIWDKNDGSTTVERADLLKQEVLYEVSETFTSGGESYQYDLRVSSDNQIDWVVPATQGNGTTGSHLGWRMDLTDLAPDVGEMVVEDPILRNGRIIFVTQIPSTAPCDYGGDGWLMELDATDGSRLDNTPWDLNQDGLFDYQEYVTVSLPDGGSMSVPASGKKSKVGIIQLPTVISAGTKEYKYASGTKEAAIEATTESTGGGGGGRTSWQQLR